MGGGGGMRGQMPDGTQAPGGNSGEPIPPDTLPHIFDRFYRGDMSHSDTEGAGLGLSMARAIVASHKGEISVISDVENGTVFTVVL